MTQRRIGLAIVSMTVLFLTTGAPTTLATVEDDWPAGSPNTCQNSDDFFLDFETGIDEIQIESTIPSMEFTTTGSLNWVYGDIRTGNYNVYPHGTQAYETNGSFFAWLGTLGDEGRIDFLGGGASYASVLVSTGSGLTLDAYDSDGILIATSGWADPNLYTRTFTRLTVEAPANQTIAYVMIHDTGNFWLIDDLCTDANKAVIPVPTRGIGSHDDRIDVIFVPDEDYGAAANIDIWLPDFIQDVQDQIDQRLNAAAPITGNLDSFNFYYTRVQGDSVYPNHNLPADITRVAPWAEVYTILHTTTFGDWTLWGPPAMFGAEGAVGRSFIHEAGHGIFGLADEYDDAPDCRTARFEPSPDPNVWDDEADCRADVTSEVWGDPDDCWMFTTCTTDWWKFTTTALIMDDGNHFANGWGQPSSRRIEQILDDNPGTAPADAPSGEPDKSIWLNMEVSGGVFTLLDESYVVAGAPNHRPGGDTFTVKVYSNGDAVLENFGIHDPRIIQAEPGTEGPTWRDQATFQLVVPYFEYCGRVDLMEAATGNVQLSVDISQYATVVAPVAMCKNITVALDGFGDATIQPADVDNGSYDPAGGAVDLSIDKSVFTCADLGENNVTLTVTSEGGAPAACTAIVTILDTTPPVIACPADLTVECDQPTDPTSTGMATATDACDSSPTIAFSDEVTPGACPQEETITRTWTATDASGNSSACVQTIEVVDTTPPDLSVEMDPDVLWPPNHKFWTVTADITVSDNCDDDPGVTLHSITSNEPDNSNGDGNTTNDVRGADTGTDDREFQLRAERRGAGDGRIYAVTYVAEDGCGNMTETSAEVRVPHDQSGSAFAWSGVATDGTGLDRHATQWSLMIPSSAEFDATGIDTERAYVGNYLGVQTPVDVAIVDYQGDGLLDLILVYDAQETRDLLGGSRNRLLGLHYQASDGTDYSVPDVMELVAPDPEPPLLQASGDAGVRGTSSEIVANPQ